jgi:proteic killer suppression protein
MAIQDYHDKRTAAFVQGTVMPELRHCERQAVKAIAKLQAATRLVELRNPPSNHFEALKGKRSGQYSIRINDKWRVCFKWAYTEKSAGGTDPLLLQGEPYDVEITDHYT